LGEELLVVLKAQIKVYVVNTAPIRDRLRRDLGAGKPDPRTLRRDLRPVRLG
jgi:hypothetical protein